MLCSSFCIKQKYTNYAAFNSYYIFVIIINPEFCLADLNRIKKRYLSVVNIVVNNLKVISSITEKKITATQEICLISMLITNFPVSRISYNFLGATISTLNSKTTIPFDILYW